jgi:hypothetical protein
MLYLAMVQVFGWLAWLARSEAGRGENPGRVFRPAHEYHMHGSIAPTVLDHDVPS